MSRLNNSLVSTPIIEEHSLATEMPLSRPNRRSRFVRRAHSSLSSLPYVFGRRSTLRSSDAPTVPADHSFISNLRAPGTLPSASSVETNHPSLTEHDESELAPIASPRRRRTGRTANLSDRLSSLRTERLSRSLNPLRRHRFSSGQSDNQIPVLAQLLSAAAVATAASLMEDDPAAAANARALGADDDASLQGFLESLQDGRMATAIQRHAAAREMNGEVDAIHGLNFVRLFRLDGTAPDDDDNPMEPYTPVSMNTPEGRMVPIIIVGIRSVITDPNSPDNIVPSLVDAITGVPLAVTHPHLVTPTDATARTENGVHQRTTSLDEMESNHRLGRVAESPRPFSAAASETSSGPRPPPSTPAVSSGATTPNGTHLGSQSSAPSRRNSIHRGLSGLQPLEESTSPRSASSRRLSESDSARFGAGSPRRNGVVGPDEDNVGARSWIIYVLGGSYPESHPLLHTPSLFTDSPTYEDMVMLSTLLGPAKPPVASEADVAAAPGLYTIFASTESEALIACSLDTRDEFVTISRDERCLVCLSDYEAMEQTRKLPNCDHMFHKTCIEQVSNRLHGVASC
jgi:hypothetical protein